MNHQIASRSSIASGENWNCGFILAASAAQSDAAVWWEKSDPEEDPPDGIERSRSYHTFFISSDGEDFTFETETDGVTEPEFMTDDFAEARWGEEPPVSRISGSCVFRSK